MKELPDFIQFKQFPGTPLNQIFTAASDDILDLLTSMLTMDPLGRCNSTKVKIYNLRQSVMSVLL